MNLKSIQGLATQYVKENSAALLTAGGVVGTVATAVLTGRAVLKAQKLIDSEQADRFHQGQSLEESELSKSEKALVIWPVFVPPVVVGAATIGSTVAANMVSAKRAAALAAAYGVSQGKLEEYKAKVQEKLTGPKQQALKDEIAQDRVTENPPKDKEVIILAGGDVLCFDMLTGRYFRSTVEQIRKAESKINADLVNHQAVSLSQFYDEIGLPATNLTDTLGWSISGQDIPVGVELSTTMTPDDKPCVAIDFNTMPSPNYNQFY